MANLIEIVKLGSAIELMAELLPTTGRIWARFRAGDAAGDWIFRGQKNASWVLQPRAMRANAFDDFSALATEEIWTNLPSHLHLEMGHVIRFVNLVSDLGYHVPGDTPQLRDPRPTYPRSIMWTHLPEIFPPSEFLDMFALAQHYGIPTRLLDWTVKPLIAAYFAASQVEDAPEIAVWGMNRQLVNKHLGCATWNSRQATIVAFISAPGSTNVNLKAQGGLFTLVQPSRDKAIPLPNLDELVAAETAIPDSDRPVIYKFTAPTSQASLVLRLLNEHGIHAGSVFPDLGGVVKALRERAKY